MKLFSSRGKTDSILCVCVILTAILGLVFIYSASHYVAEKDFSNKFYYFTKQAVGFAIGICAMFFASKINLDLVKKFSLPILIVAIILLGLVFVPGVGVENYGAKRWLKIGGVSFQPSEIAKFAFVLFSATFM